MAMNTGGKPQRIKTHKPREWNKEKQPMDRILIKANTLIHIAGIPFYLEKETWVLGKTVNYKLAKELTEHETFTGQGVTDSTAS